MASITVNGVTYGKPNMAALEGELGRRIMETIRSTPRPDFTEIDKKCAEYNARIAKAKEDGTF